MGESSKPLNLILDTGSSSLAIRASAVENNKGLIATSLAQHVFYGKGQWYGPVVKETISMGHSEDLLALPEVNVALAYDNKSHVFSQADGILGLAYNALNKAYDLTSILVENQITPHETFPWARLEGLEISKLNFNVNDFPLQHIKPYFTQLEEHQLTANKFAFIVHRSSTYQMKASSQLSASEHPLNHGIFVLGNPESQQHFHCSEFQDVKVVHDKYYNINITSVFIDPTCKIRFPSLQPKYQKAYISNGIVDSGASAMVFPASVFTQLLEQFIDFNPDFEEILSAFREFTGEEIGIPITSVNLDSWPNLFIEVQGIDDNLVTLKLDPRTYWQTHAPQANEISFKITTLPNWPNQGILGLPLMNNYYTIFDREFALKADHLGRVRFTSKAFAPHMLSDTAHQDIENMHLHFKQNRHKLMAL